LEIIVSDYIWEIENCELKIRIQLKRNGLQLKLSDWSNSNFQNSQFSISSA